MARRIRRQYGIPNINSKNMIYYNTTRGSLVIRKGPLGLALILLLVFPAGVLVFLYRVKSNVSNNNNNPHHNSQNHYLKIQNDDVSKGGNVNAPVLAQSGSYTGPLWKTEQTVGRVLLGETPFARCDVHSVIISSSSSSSVEEKDPQPKIIHDWIFMEERDAVNVVVMTREGKNFLAFQQRKYAIPGETLSPVGGFINNGEAPFDAARREVWEELGVGSQRTLDVVKEGGSTLTSSTESKESPFGTSTTPVAHDAHGLLVGDVSDDEISSWVFLGKYRTMANRGGGFIYTYLLIDAVPLVEGGGTSAYLSHGDAEDQTLLFLSKDQMSDAVMQGRFQEVKWAATVALALLHLERNEKK